VEVSEEIRRLPPEQAANHMLKRSRAAHNDMMGPPPPMQGPVGIPCLLPPDLEVEFEANDAMHLEGLEGLVTVEYRLLIPDRKVGAILGSGGSVSGGEGVVVGSGGSVSRGEGLSMALAAAGVWRARRREGGVSGEGEGGAAAA
jgi:hypothetical protein